ncbi:MAG: DUF3857 domain-containing protein [Bacteroidota bacterium]
MHKISFSITLCILSFLGAFSQQISYDGNTIPDSLKKKAASVVRLENIEFEITDIDRARLYVHRIITILNENGAKALLFEEGTDKFESLEDAEIKLYSPDGKAIEKYKQRDISSYMIGDGLVPDGKLYYKQMHATVFPVTIEYSYTKRYKGIINYPRYEILTPEEGVENSLYKVRVPKDLDLRYKEKNIHLPPVITEDDKYKTYSWSVQNIAPVKYEEGAVSYESRYPSILLAPNHFKLDDYEGDMTSWESFGKWYANLKQGADILPDDRKKFYADLVRSAKDDREKIRIIYNYLQNNFRYVSIQLGIGGFRPFSAQFTDEKKYGDCKALCNYMQAVLTSINIKSYQALINASYNKEPVDPAFPCNQFNHVILCIPGNNDSIWLECTSRTTGFGELGNFTENRNALVITEKGGQLVATPKSKASDNTFNVYTTVVLKGNGSGTTTSFVNGTGEYKQNLISLMDEKADEQKNKIVSSWNFKDPDSIAFVKTTIPEMSTILIKQDLEKIPELKTESKMFLPSRVYSIWSTKLPKSENRKLDFYFRCPFEKRDTTIFKIPEGYKLEALPAGKSIQNNYTQYTSKYWFDDKTNIVYSTSLIILKQYKISAVDYPSVKKFFDDVLMDNSERIILKKTD